MPNILVRLLYLPILILQMLVFLYVPTLPWTVLHFITSPLGYPLPNGDALFVVLRWHASNAAWIFTGGGSFDMFPF